MVKVKSDKDRLNTYSRNKRVSRTTKPTVIIVNQVFNITNVNNYYFNNKSSSGDEFDRLLKGPVYNAQTHSSPSSSKDEKKNFLKRQDTISFYNSDATTSSTFSSVHLFKDTLKDSCEVFSPSVLPTPAEYSKKNNKLVKVTLQRKKNNRVFKKNKKKVKEICYATKNIKKESAASSTPTRPNFLPSQSCWIEPYVSPILPLQVTQKKHNFNNSVSLCNTFDVEENEANKSSTKPKGDSGMTALLEGLGNLGLSTPYQKGKQNIGEKQSCRKELYDSTPSQVSIKNNTYIGRKLRSTTKKNEVKIKEPKLEESGEVKEKDNYNVDDSAPSNKLMNYNLTKISQERLSDHTFNDKIMFTRNLFNINQRRTKNKFRRTVSSPKQEMNSADLFFNKHDSEIFMHKPISQDDISVNLNCDIETKYSNTELIGNVKTIPNLLDHEKEKSVDLLINYSQTSPFLKDVTNSFSSKVVSSQPDVCTHNNSQEGVMICHVNGNRNTELSDTQCSKQKRNSEVKEKVSSPERQDANMKHSLNLIPGKKWRRSFLLQKQIETKRSTVGPAILVKLVRDASLSFISNKSCNVTAKSIAQAMEADENLSYKTDNISFDFSNNSILNNTFELLRRVSIRTKRNNDNFGKRKCKQQNCVYNYAYDLDKIPEEGSLCQISHVNTSETEWSDTSGVKVLSPHRDQSFEEIIDVECDQTYNSNAESKHSIEIPPVELDATESKLTTPKTNNVDQAYMSLFEKSGKASFHNSQYDLLQRSDVTISSIESSAIPSTPDNISKKSCNQLCNDTGVGDDDELDMIEPFNSPLTKQRKMLTETTVWETPPFLKINPKAVSSITKRRKTVMRPEKTYHMLELSEGDFNKLLRHEEQYPHNEELLNEDKCLSPILFDDEMEISQLIENMEEHECRQIGEMGVLLQCSLQQPLSFEEVFSDSILANCKKIGEGVYGEVFMLQHHDGSKSVVKIIPVEGTQLVNNEHQKLFSEVLSELIITEELSLLRENSQFYTIGFCELKNKHCLQGEYPAMLIDLWHKYNKEKGSDNDCPDIFRCDQRYIALELEHAGEPVESYIFLSAKQAYSAFLQTAFSLSIAEASLEFEHRDLHIGNVLVKKTTDDYVKYIQNGYVFKVPTYGVQATIIDFTLSRISYKNDVLFFDMATDPELFTAQGDYQFEIYRIMRDQLRNNWKGHEPVTNIRWLHYLLDKFVTKVKYRNKKTKTHTHYLKIMTHIKEIILDFLSTYDLTEFFLQSYTETLSIIVTE